ncbi:MAG TPA: hypothetical protein VGQ55_09670 [Pyrinomonadaceae bacterium]|nr:hypothetical protein [Pyrinomonadaceae bacterium]
MPTSSGPITTSKQVTKQDLGRIVAIHNTSPIFLQRASIVALVSLVFFLVMLLAFSIRQQFGYFVIATAFLIVCLFTMVGIWMQKRNSVKIYENGITYKKFRARWSELTSVKANTETGIEIGNANGEKVVIGSAVEGLSEIALQIRSHLT